LGMEDIDEDILRWPEPGWVSRVVNSERSRLSPFFLFFFLFFVFSLYIVISCVK